MTESNAERHFGRSRLAGTWRYVSPKPKECCVICHNRLTRACLKAGIYLSFLLCACTGNAEEDFAIIAGPFLKYPTETAITVVRLSILITNKDGLETKVTPKPCIAVVGDYGTGAEKKQYRYIRYSGTNLDSARFTTYSEQSGCPWLEGEGENVQLSSDFQEELYNRTEDPLESVNLLYNGYNTNEVAIIEYLASAIPATMAPPVLLYDRYEVYSSVLTKNIGWEVDSICSMDDILNEGESGCGVCDANYGVVASPYVPGCGWFIPTCADEIPYIGMNWASSDMPQTAGGAPTFYIDASLFDGRAVNEIQFFLTCYDMTKVSNIAFNFPKNGHWALTHINEWDVETLASYRNSSTGGYIISTSISNSVHLSACTKLRFSRRLTNSSPSAMIEPLIGFEVLLSSANAVVHFSMPPQVEIGTDPPTYEYTYMIFNDTTTCNCQEFDFINNKNDCYNDQPTDAHCGIIKQELMSRPALKYEYRFKAAVPDAVLRKAISDAINSTYNVTYGAFGWPCKAEELTELHAENIGLSDPTRPNLPPALRGILGLTKLEEIWLGDNPNLKSLYDMAWAESGAYSPLPLKRAHLENCTGLGYNASTLHNFHDLEFLDLSGCTSLTCLKNTLWDPLHAS